MTLVILLLLFYVTFSCQWYFWAGFPRIMIWDIYDKNGHINNVCRFGVVNIIYTSSDEKDTGEK